MKAPIVLPSWYWPMLLERYFPGAMEFPVWVERKYNGFRCVIVVPDPRGNSFVSEPAAFSREGRVLEAGTRAAREIAERCGPGYYDGELVGPSFRATASAVKSKNPSSLRYKCWDRLIVLPMEGRMEVALTERKSWLAPLMAPPWADTVNRCVDLVPGGWVWSEEELERALDLAIRRGWEGLVIKNGRSGYRCGVRSRNWMKLKPQGVA